MISIKKFLDSKSTAVLEQDTSSGEIPTALMDCYRAALTAFGRSAGRLSPELANDLEARLRGLEQRLSFDVSTHTLAATSSQVEAELQEWGSRAAGHFKAQADTVKELLLALAKTAEGVSSRSQGQTGQFKQLTGSLENIARMNDLAQIKSSVISSVAGLHKSIEQMTRDNQALVSQLQSELSAYETKLKSAEHLAFKDELTGLSNRRGIEDRLQRSIATGQEFSILILDLNRFKQLNDQHGHLAGDDLLKQFSKELQSNIRPSDLVGRWGGDEFIVILACNLQNAEAPLKRVREWVFGKYTIQVPGKNPVIFNVDAGVGTAEWNPGKTLQQLIDEADAAMYVDKEIRKHAR